MKTIKNINIFALILPFAILFAYPFIQEGAFIFSLLSTMITGFLQFCIGVKMLVDNPNDKKLQIYIAGVVLFLFYGTSMPKLIIMTYYLLYHFHYHQYLLYI
ncbi:hypothetical protein PMI10_00230 [Flavobacterium sp. CF136]|nr:hypothetical protein PMI10_00230 [Flavobacterium sp. CF136]